MGLVGRRFDRPHCYREVESSTWLVNRPLDCPVYLNWLTRATWEHRLSNLDPATLLDACSEHPETSHFVGDLVESSRKTPREKFPKNRVLTTLEVFSFPFFHCLSQVKGLRKVYPTSKGAKVAVKSTSLGIPRGECFGLLGTNGAGKSSTLAILSG